MPGPEPPEPWLAWMARAMCWVGMLISITEASFVGPPWFRDQATGPVGLSSTEPIPNRTPPRPMRPSQPHARNVWITNSSSSNNLTPNQNVVMLGPVTAEPVPSEPAAGLESAVRQAHGAGWIWGDEGEGIPPGAALSELMIVASRTMGACMGQLVQGSGLTPAGLAVLRVLEARDGLKSSEVAARGWSTPGTVTTVVDTLVRDGLVRRERDFTDRRVVRLFVTERGMDKLIETLAEVGPRWRAAFDYVDPADEPAIRQFLIDTIERFSTLIRKERGT